MFRRVRAAAHRTSHTAHRHTSTGCLFSFQSRCVCVVRACVCVCGWQCEIQNKQEGKVVVCEVCTRSLAYFNGMQGLHRQVGNTFLVLDLLVLADHRSGDTRTRVHDTTHPEEGHMNESEVSGCWCPKKFIDITVVMRQASCIIMCVMMIR